MKARHHFILETIIENVSRKRKPSLVSILFEDIDDEIKIAANAGPAAVRKLSNSYIGNEDFKNALDGMYDKVEKDDKVNVVEVQTKNVGDFIPTQKEIDLMKSIAYPLKDFEKFKKVIVTKTTDAPDAITVSGNEIIDGHHRWAEVWGMHGSSGEIDVQDLELKGDTAQKLAAAQLAIAAYKPVDVPHPAEAEKIDNDILGKSKDEIKELINKNVSGSFLSNDFLENSSNDADVAKWAKFKIGETLQNVKKKIIEKISNNLSSLPANPNAPKRIDMPQFSHKSMGNKKQVKNDIFVGLKAGKFNVNEPFSPNEANESQKRREDVLLERWQRLAGIYK